MGEVVSRAEFERLRATKLLHTALVLKDHASIGETNAAWLDEYLTGIRNYTIAGVPITMGEIKEAGLKHGWDKRGA